MDKRNVGMTSIEVVICIEGIKVPDPESKPIRILRTSDIDLSDLTNEDLSDLVENSDTSGTRERHLVELISASHKTVDGADNISSEKV